MIYKLLFSLVLFCSSIYGQDTFFNVAIGPDMVVKNPGNGVIDGSMLRLELELGSKNIGFTFQPAFGGGASTFYMGPRLMMPFQIGSRPLFIVPDVSAGPDFGFMNGDVGLALDFKFGIRLFYELSEGIGFSFRPFGFTLKTFDVWFGDTPNQTQLAVRYELMFGFTYFF